MKRWNVAPITEFDEYSSIAGESLQYYDSEIWKTYVRRVGAENFRGVWAADGTFAGGLAFYRMGQWYGGRNVPTAGVSGVAVDPAARGSGACKTLLIEMLKELHQEGFALASLYASTQRLYRSVGFEQTGTNFTYSLPMSSLRSLHDRRQLGLQRFTQPDFEVLQAVTELRAKRTNGNLQRTTGLWERVVEPIGLTTSTYIFGDQSSPQGFATFQHGSRAAGYPQPLIASDWVANTPEALQRLISLVLDHRSMCDCFRWNGGPADPLLMAAEEQNVSVAGHLRTLSRVVRFQDTLSSRGYPNHVRGELHFAVSDDLLSDNSGNWRVVIADGTAQIEPGGRGCLRMDIQYAAPLLCSYASCSDLVNAGYLDCGDASQIELADVVFAGPTPWTCELF